MHIDEGGPEADTQRAAFAARIRDEIDAASGEAFKLITEL